MKTLLILRHAKAQPDAPAGDWARHLTARGRRDATTMGRYILDQIGRPDAVVASDAHRARETAELAAEAIGFNTPIAFDHAIYDAELADLLAVVRSLRDDAEAVLLVGHNPGFETLAAALAGLADGEIRLPTSGLAHLALAIDRWAAVRLGTARLVAIRTPKEIDRSGCV